MGEKTMTGYPSVDKPWMKHYSEATLNYPFSRLTVYSYLEEKVSEYLDDTAIVYFGKKIKYSTLLENIKRTAAGFTAIGVKAGDIVAIALPNIPENIYCLYALNYIGAIADMIDLRSKGDTLQRYLEMSHAKVAVVCDMFAENTLSVLNTTDIHTVVVASPLDSAPSHLRLFARIKQPKYKYTGCAVSWSDFFTGSNVIPQPHTDPDAVAFIAHTSGTTSAPKGVMLTNMNVNSLINQYISIGFKHSKGDIMMNQVPPFLAYSFLSFHMPFSMDMSVTLLPEYRPDLFAKNLKKYKPNHVFAGPGDWSNLLSNKQTDYSYLITNASGSDKLDETTKRNIEAVLQKGGCKNPILEGYGMTECCSAACTQQPWNMVYGSVGTPLPEVNLCIFDNDANAELKYGEVGEICISGTTVMKGYYCDEEATKEALRCHPDGEIWLHSGDLGYIDENGNVYLIGRLKRLIVRYDGIKVPPTSVENVIVKHEAVSACCVVGAPDVEHGRGQKPVAFVVMANGVSAQALTDTLIELCKSELPEKYIPVSFPQINALPLSANGKVDYRSLEKEAAKLKV